MNTSLKKGRPTTSLEKAEKMAIVRAAEAFLGHGWQPLPIPRGAKGPVMEGWQNFRAKPSELEAHFGNPTNIGLLLGEPSGGLIDVDIDHAAALRLSAMLPATNRIHGRSAKPSSHYWYRATGSVPKTQRFRDPISGETLIEFRSTGGQTVVPPSVYQFDGGHDQLAWVVEEDPADIDGAHLHRTVSQVAACALIAKNFPKESGSRHDIALALGGFLLRGGLAQEVVEDLIERICDAADDDEVADRVRTVVDSADRLKAGLPIAGQTRLEEFFDPRVVAKAAEWLGLSNSPQSSQEVSWDTPIPFQEAKTPEIAASVLPGVHGEFAKAVSEAAEVPVSMAVMAVLGAISAATTKKFVVLPKSRWTESMNLYVMIALPPANNKSFVLREAMAPIESWEFDRNLAMQPEIRAAASSRKNEESTIQSLRVKAGKHDDAEKRRELFAQVTELEANLTVVPVPPRVFVNDVTPESLSSSIAEQDGRIAIISDEGGVTETLAGLYSGGHSNFDVLLKGYDGGRVRLKRKDRELDIRPFISMLLFVQPQVLRNMTQQKSFQGRGLFERILYLIPNSKLGYRTLDTKPVPDSLTQRYSTAVRALLDIPVQESNGFDDSPRILTLSAEARDDWAAFRKEVEAGLRPDGNLQSCLGWGGKIAGTCVRIAGLLHVAEHGLSTSVIGRETMNRALTICRALIQHAVAAFAMMQTDQAVQDAEAIAKWIELQGEPRFSRTDCFRKFHGRLTQKRYDAALATLQHHNIIGPEIKALDSQTGRSRRYYAVNPMMFDRKP